MESIFTFALQQIRGFAQPLESGNMKKLLLFFALASQVIAAPVAGDLVVQRRNAANTKWNEELPYQAVALSAYEIAIDTLRPQTKTFTGAQTFTFAAGTPTQYLPIKLVLTCTAGAEVGIPSSYDEGSNATKTSFTMPAMASPLTLTFVYIGSTWHVFGIPALGGVDFARATAETQVAGIHEYTASATLVLTDAGKLVQMNNGSANTLTVPPNSSVAFPINTVIPIVQMGAGQCTITAGSGVTLRARNGAKTGGQYGVATIIKIATDTWVVCGDTAS